MERYTTWENGKAVIRGDSVYSDWGVPEGFMGDAIDRLAAYEDTGLEPEEIRENVGFMTPVCVGCDGKTEDGKRTEKCTYEDGCVKKCLERSVHLYELAVAEAEAAMEKEVQGNG